jgi:hypothetical protein
MVSFFTASKIGETVAREDSEAGTRKEERPEGGDIFVMSQRRNVKRIAGGFLSCRRYPLRILIIYIINELITFLSAGWPQFRADEVEYTGRYSRAFYIL